MTKFCPNPSILLLPKVYVIILLIFLINTYTTAQVATYYNFSQSSGTYTPGTPTGVSTPAAIFSTAWDDLAYTGYTLPFNFNFNGTVYPAGSGVIGLDTDGWFCFSNGVPVMTGQLGGGSWVTASDHTGMYLYGNANNNGFAGFNADLNAQSLPTFTGTRTSGSNTITGVSSFSNIQIGTRLSGTGIPNGTIVTAFGGGTITMSANATGTSNTAVTPMSSIFAFTRGTAPNRQFVVQWTQAKRYNSPSITGDNFNFQMILNEGGGVANLQTLQVVFGTMTAVVTDVLETQVGLRGATSADFNARSSTGNWAATTAASANSDHVRFSNSITPASGLTFTWSPCTGPPAAAGALSGPSPVCPGTSQVYSLAAVSGATQYTWSYSGTNTTFSAVTTAPSNSFYFAPNATAGTITVTPSNFCGSSAAATRAVAVTAVSVADISYPSAVVCTSSPPVNVILTGPGGGSFSTSPAGLSLNAVSGQVTPATSAEGNYFVIYSYTNNGCAMKDTASLTIKGGPAATASATPSLVCNGGNSQLQVSVPSGYSVSPVAYSALTPSGTPNIIWNSYIDDGVSAAIPLPFTFVYYGQNITQLYACTNGYIMLGSNSGSNITPQTVPDAGTPNNVIALAWDDLLVDPSINAGAYVRYFVNGTAPNRVFVVEYYNLCFFGFPDEGVVSGQIRLYEGSNNIDVSAAMIDDNGNGYSKTLGIEDATGSQGVSPAGRNNAVWNVTNEAWRFSVAGAASYLWSPATYLSNTTVANPVASGVAASTNYTVRVTDLASLCYTDVPVTVTVSAPLSGTYTVGATGNFTTLTAAINAYNNLCIGGPVVFSLIDNNYSTSEVFPLDIKSNIYASAVNTLTIKPAAGVSPTISGSNVTGIFRFNGADHVTIDGSNTVGGTSRDLAIVNTSANVDSSKVIYMMAASASNGATYNTIKNSNIRGNSSTTTWCAIFGGGSDLYGLPPTANSNNTYSNNSITRAVSAIALVGPAGNENNNLITQNSVGSTTPADKLGFSGIELYQQAGAQVTANDINGIIWSSSSSDAYGILSLGTSSNCTISGNRINEVQHTSVWGAHGIYLGNSGTASNMTVSNNMISNVVSQGFNSFGERDNGYGISVTAGGGYKLYFNSVALTVNPTLTGAHRAASLFVGPSVTTAGAIDLRNNIFSNHQTIGNTNSRYAMLVMAANNVFSSINYNVYYSASSNLLCRGTNALTFTTLAALQGNIGGNLNSVAATPSYVSATNLHLNAAANAAISNTGQVIAGIVADYDNQTRNGLNPDPGADEFVGPNYGSWVGRVSTDWTNPQNWEANFVPLSTTDVFIHGGYAFMPTVTTVQPMRNLNLSAPGPSSPPILTVNGGTIQVYGSINKTGGTVIASNGTLEMSGSAAQTIPASMFQANNLLNLIISNTNNVTGVSLGGDLDVYRSVTFSPAGLRLTTNNRLTFKSTFSETAWLGNVTGKTITGNATVERYIGTGVTAGHHTKSWQLLAVPVSGPQTVRAAWQEGSLAPNDNLKPGFGTQLTSELPNATSLGFDVYTQPGPSIKTYVPATNLWAGLANTTSTQIYNKKGYMILVRGDRSVQAHNSPAVPTVLRTSGKLFTTGADLPGATTVLAGRMESVGNPYASAIDFRLLFKTNVSDIFYLWDPRLTTAPNSAYGLGGFQTFTKDMAGDYRVTPGGGSFGAGGSVNNVIQSGAAFFVQSSQPLAGANGTLSFSETAKVSGSTLVHRGGRRVEKELRVNLSVSIGGEKVLLDGVLAQFDASYRNVVDGNDARKMGNTGENMGLLRNGTLLSVERRGSVTVTDTLFLHLGQVRVQNYNLDITASNLARGNMRAWLVDLYTNISTSLDLSGITSYSFSVNPEEASYQSGRFIIVFKKPKISPVFYFVLTGTTIRKGANRLAWTWKDGVDMNGVVLEKAEDGRNFSELVRMTAPLISGTQSFIDETPRPGDNHYRIRSLGKNAAPYFSNTVMLNNRSTPTFTIYPNPFVGKVTLKYGALVNGIYTYQVSNSAGQVLIKNSFSINKQGSLDLMLNLLPGNYQFALFADDGRKIFSTGILKQ